MKAIAIVSMLGERGRVGSARLRIGGRSVLAATLARLGRCTELAASVVLCWEEQAAEARDAAGGARVEVATRAPAGGLMESLAAARRWSDGWRGGLLGTTCYDAGFSAGDVDAIARSHEAGAVVLVEAGAALVDPALVNALVARMSERADFPYSFCAAAPGLAGLVVRAEIVAEMARVGGYPGRLMTYWPEVPSREPLTRDECLHVAAAITRTSESFTVDGLGQAARLTRALGERAGDAGAEEVVRLVAEDAARHAPDGPREVVLELTTGRATRPIYWAGRYVKVEREELDLRAAEKLFAEMAAGGETRLTLAGVGDPLRHSRFVEVLAAAREAGIAAVHVESDLVGVCGEVMDGMVKHGVDIVSVVTPATSVGTYEKVMGIDGLGGVLDAMRSLLQRRQDAGRGVPLIVPTFVKCAANAHEMEGWYDTWIGAMGCAVVRGPSACGGSVPEVGVADMTPPRRVGCRRLGRRLTVLCDGRMVACEEDVIGRQEVGTIGEGLGAAWARQQEMARVHAAAGWDRYTVCGGCREWHRP